MGIVNITPDSFSDGGLAWESESALRHIEGLVKAGADWIDLGASSSKPGTVFQSAEEEISRLDRVLSRYFEYFDTPVSVDTVHHEVARYALERGVKMINDISAMTFDPKMGEVVAAFQVPVVVMHMQGLPKTMQDSPHYEDVLSEVVSYLMERVAVAQGLGIREIILDPGIGFGKTLAHNLNLLRGLKAIVALGYPVLLGPSRKSFIGELAGAGAQHRLGGTVAACVWGALQGVKWFRVHDVFEVKQALRVMGALGEIE